MSIIPLTISIETRIQLILGHTLMWSSLPTTLTLTIHIFIGTPRSLHYSMQRFGTMTLRVTWKTEKCSVLTLHGFGGMVLMQNMAWASRQSTLIMLALWMVVILKLLASLIPTISSEPSTSCLSTSLVRPLNSSHHQSLEDPKRMIKIMSGTLLICAYLFFVA